MSEVTVDIKELEELAERAPNIVTQVLELIAIEAYGNLRREAPKGRTGFLADSIVGPIQIGPATFGINIGAPYWQYVYLGTPPHTIKAVNAKALYFYWAKVGEWVFFKKVEHPGTSPNPFVDRALDAAGKRAEEFTELVLDRIGAS